jgi:radical SAM protein with 4Fe4S-binding SPASM domain
VVCLIDPIGDVYACPFAIHDRFLAGNIPRDDGFAPVWRESRLFQELRSPQSGGACSSCSAYDSCRGGCMAAKFFTGLPLDGPDPECVKGNSETALAAPGRIIPAASQDHSRPSATIERQRPAHACDDSPLTPFIPLESLIATRA